MSLSLNFLSCVGGDGEESLVWCLLEECPQMGACSGLVDGSDFTIMMSLGAMRELSDAPELGQAVWSALAMGGCYVEE